MYYLLANGFHNTQAAVRVREGGLISGRAMLRAGRKLCGSRDCTCTSSAASAPREGQETGVRGRPKLGLHPASDYPARARAAGWDGTDMDAHILIDHARLNCHCAACELDH